MLSSQIIPPGTRVLLPYNISEEVDKSSNWFLFNVWFIIEVLTLLWQ
jgi:hypothetical protein